jgi:hypothetical protein
MPPWQLHVHPLSVETLIPCEPVATMFPFAISPIEGSS